MNILRLTAFLVGLCCALPAFAAPDAVIRESVAVCDPNAPTSCNVANVGATPTHIISTASNNSTSVAVGSRNLFGIYAINTDATTAYLKFYNSATAPTCGTDPVLMTVPLVQNIPVTTAMQVGVGFSTGIGVCIVAGIADNDNTNATTGIVVSMEYK